MKPFTFRTNRSVFGMLVVAGVMATLAGCDPDLVFDNEYDPQASNSPLSRSITNFYAWDYMDATNGKVVGFGWDLVPEAISYEYQVARMWGRETPEEAFRRVASGDGELALEGTVEQPTDGTNPFELVPADDGVYATRVRYQATATHNGVTSDVWGPWSSPQQAWLGVPFGFFPTAFIERGEWFAGSFYYRGDRYIISHEAFGSGAIGNTVSVYIQDEWSGYRDGQDGADPYIRVYDVENSFDGPFREGEFRFDKWQTPVTFQMPASEHVYIVLESDNPDDTFFEIRIDY